jgi:hypothetical protein
MLEKLSRKMLSIQPWISINSSDKAISNTYRKEPEKGEAGQMPRLGGGGS